MFSSSIPEYAKNLNPVNMDSPRGFSFSPSMFAGGIGQFLGGMFGDTGAPYEAAADQFRQWGQKAETMQKPFWQAGVDAIPQYQGWLKGMSDPSKFINNLVGSYQQSPYAKYLMQQSNRAGLNAASASGTMGSTPLMQQIQQNANDISSGDMNQWMQNVLGINNLYGAGQMGMMNMGQNSANALTNLYGDLGKSMAEMSFGSQAGDQNDMWNTIGGIAGMGAAFL